MAQLPNLAAPEMRTAAGFHRYDARPELAEERQHMIASQLLAKHRLARAVSAMDLKHALRQIEPNRGIRILVWVARAREVGPSFTNRILVLIRRPAPTRMAG